MVHRLWWSENEGVWGHKCARRDEYKGEGCFQRGGEVRSQNSAVTIHWGVDMLVTHSLPSLCSICLMHTHTHTHTGPSFDPILSLQQWWNVPCQQHCRVRFLGEALGSVGEYQLVRAPLARSWRLSPSARVGERACACLIVYYSAGSVWWCVGTQSRCVFVCVCVCVPDCKCIERIGGRININNFLMQVKDLGVFQRWESLIEW